MATPPPPRTVDLEPAKTFPLKPVLLGVAVLAIGAAAWAIWSRVNDSKKDEVWDEAWKIGSERGESSARDWLVPSGPGDLVYQRDLVRRLEDFLAKHESETPLAPHLHYEIASHLRSQLLGMGDSGTFETRKPLYDAAIAHLETIREKFPDFASNREQFRPAGARSLTDLLLDRLREERAWDEKHGLRPPAADEDVVVLLRTTKGDLRLRTLSKDAPKRVAAFVERVCKGELDGTSFFTSRGDVHSPLAAMNREAEGQTWVRGGDARTRVEKTPPAKDRAEWGTPTPATPVPPEPSRHHVQHVRGVVSAWHDVADDEDDPEQFLIVVRDSPDLDHQYTPFAIVMDEKPSLETLDRIFSQRTIRQDRDATSAALDDAAEKVADQFVDPVKIVKALVYEKDALKDCPRVATAATIRDSEKKLSTVKVDEDVPPPPPPPPAPPAPGAMEGSAPPPAPGAMGDGPMDGPPPPAGSPDGK
jgi:cyclophilin family peptidyl-prolyl cis-trans isomerase